MLRRNKRYRIGPRLAALAVALIAVTAIVAGGGGAPFAHADEEQPPTVAELRALVPGDGGRWAEVTVLVDTTVGDPEAALAAVAPTAVQEQGVSAAYVLWRQWALEDMPVEVSYNPAYDTSFSAREAMRWAIEEWNGIEGSSFRFTEGPDTDGTMTREMCVANEGDGVNSFRLSYAMSPGTLGSTCVVWESTSDVPRALEFDITINGNVDWTEEEPLPQDKYDLRSTVLHELGHALGLHHTDSPGAVMLSNLKRGTQQRTITDDDRDGVLALYGEKDMAFRRFAGMVSSEP